MAQAIQDALNAERKAERDVFKGLGALLETFGAGLSEWVQNLVETMATQLNDAQSQLAALQQRSQQAETDFAEIRKNASTELEDMRKNMLETETKLAEANAQVSDMRQRLAAQHDAEDARVHALQLQLQHERDKLSETAQGFTAAMDECNKTQQEHMVTLRTQNDALQGQVDALQNRDRKRKQSVMRILQNFEDSLGEDEEHCPSKRQCTKEGMTQS
jgi:chromosome segregation ATPase